LATYVREHEYQDGTWSLVENDILEETIAINTLSLETNIEYQSELWKLNKRFAVINDGAPVDEHNNPLSPLQFCVALRSSLRLLDFDIKTKLTAYKTFATLIYKHYETVILAVNNYFIAEGILPHLTYEKSEDTNPSQANDHPKGEQTLEEREDSSFDNSLSPDSEKISGQYSSELELVNAIRDLLKETRSYKAPSVQPDGSGGFGGAPINIFTNDQLVGAVENIQSNTANVLTTNSTLTPINIAANSENLSRALKEKSPDGEIDAKDMYTIDLVGMLFEYILTDENLPDSIKTLLSHLHTPFLKLAFIDTRFFEKKEHPSRLLLDSLAEAGANWVNHDGSAQYDMYNEIKLIVNRVMEEFKNDVHLFAELLMEFNLLKKKITHMHKLKERNSIEKTQGQEKLRQAKALARHEIKQRIKGRRLPASIIALLSPWFTYLTFIQLRNGDNTEQWNQALKLIDDLLLYSSIKHEQIDVARLSDNFNYITEAVGAGLKSIAYNPTKTTEIINGLNVLKQCILDKRALKTTPAEATKIVAEPDTKEVIDGKSHIKHPEEPVFEDTSHPSAQAPEYDPTQPEDEPTPEEEKVINYLKLIEPGTWIEFTDKVRLKVSGFSSKVSKYMLVDQTSQKVVMRSRLDLARDVISGRAKVVTGSTKPLFERALEKIFQNLDEQAKATT